MILGLLFLFVCPSLLLCGAKHECLVSMHPPCIAPRQWAETDLGLGDARQLCVEEQGACGHRSAEFCLDLDQ